MRSFSNLVFCFSASCSQSAKGNSSTEADTKCNVCRATLSAPGLHRDKLMELSLACPFSLCQFFEPWHIFPCVFDTARDSIPDELKSELHAFQGWIEAHQVKRPLVLGHSPVARQMLNRKEIFIERDVKFRGT